MSITEPPAATKQIFLNVPEALGLEDAQVDDVTKDLWAQLTDLGITTEEYQQARALAAVTTPKAQYLDGWRKALNQIRAVTPYLMLSTLPDSGRTTANTKLEYRWEPLDEDLRLKRIEGLFSGFAKKDSLELDVVDHQIARLTTWQTDLVISPIDALLWLGIDPQVFLIEKPDKRKLQQAIERYCELARHLSNVPGLTLGDYYNGCIKKDGAKPHEDCLKGWLRLPTKQTEGGALTVRRMPINPATWFQVDETVYSVAPMHTPALVNDLPEGNKVKKAAVGDIISMTTFLHTNPFVVRQIAAGTCPRIDVAGTRLRRDGAFTLCPRVYRNDSSADLDGGWSDGALGRYGSFVAAWE